MDDTATQVGRIGLTFVGTVAFCLLSLLSPDSALLSDSQKLNVPFAGPVSFFGFMVLGPAVLIVLRVYLQVYVEHSERLDRLARRMPVVRAPTLLPLKNPLIRAFSGFAFYLLLPLAMLPFAWKAAVFPAWGSGLLCVAAAVSAIHLMLALDRFSWLPLHNFSWLPKIFLGVGAAILALGLMAGFGSPHRPFNLARANLSGTDLSDVDLRHADLSYANLSGARLSGGHLRYANLYQAKLESANLELSDLSSANLDQADLRGVDLSKAHLYGAKLSKARLYGTDLSKADLRCADLSDADLSKANLSGANLSGNDHDGSAKLRNAILSNANLSGADLRQADLRNAHLGGTNLSDADLSGDLDDPLGPTDLTDADLSNANLSGADLSGADLSGSRNLTPRQLGEACGTDAMLPRGLTLKKPCPAK